MLISANWLSTTLRVAFALVERVAEEIADLLLQKFNSPWVRIISKPGAVARAANVGVIIERGSNLNKRFSS